MSEPVEVPTLGLGREQTQQWTQAAMMLLTLIRQRREALGRTAWSDAEAAARDADRLERIRNPTVRTMDAEEQAAFEQVLREDTNEETQTRRAEHPGGGSVTITVAPLRHGDAWGLRAHGVADDGTAVGLVLFA